MLSAIAFLSFFITASVLAFVRGPIFGLVAYIGVFYIHPPARWWGQGILLNVRWSLIAAGVTLLAIWLRREKQEGRTSFFRQKFVVGFLLFIAWALVQSFWALDIVSHRELISYYLKFLIAMYLIYSCVDSVRNLRIFLYTHVAGCLYLGYVAFTTAAGGRFEGFGSPGISEANAGALQIVTGILVAAALFLASGKWGKAFVVGAMPFIVNALATTISRSGFLAFTIGGLIFNFFTPTKLRRRVVTLSVVGVVLLVMLTDASYWNRIQTIKYRGQEVEGVETGAGRLEIIRQQWRMFELHPLGCGHMCTTYLSPIYLPDALTEGGRASHNTFMTMLVDHGVPGAIFYIALAWFIYSRLRELENFYRRTDGFLPTVYPAVAGILGAIFVADLFVQYPKLEVRFWFIAILMAMHQMMLIDKSTSGSEVFVDK